MRDSRQDGSSSCSTPTPARSGKRSPRTAPKQPRNLGLQGNIAIYSVGSELHAVNLSSGNDRVVAQLNGGIYRAEIDEAGLVYAGNGFGTHYGKGTIAFVPFARIAAAVG
jgi:hypothetical protein